jgi:hypothetical protein
VLTEEQIGELEARWKKIALVDWDGHQIVFARPTREQIRDYRRKQEVGAQEKADALEQLAQATIVAYDGVADQTKARVAFTSGFLEEYPAAVGSSRFTNALSWLAGSIEEETAEALGKGVSVRSSRPKTSGKASLPGSDPSREARN